MPTPVKLHLYDLSNGMARNMSLSIIGKQLDGIWHSGIAVFGIEYFYGGGICAAPAGRAIPHLPYQEIDLGTTSKTQIELEVFLQSINSRFTQATYSLLRHNCNNFANEVSQFLLGKGIPEHIIRLPLEFLASPMGAVLAPMIESMEMRMRQEMVGGGQGLNPFGHIQGRQRLFNDAPAVTAPPTVSSVGAPSAQWMETDPRLLKTAIDGIPSTVMTDELKLKIVAINESVIPELVAFMAKHYKEKTPILLSFATIARFYWKFAAFRTQMMDIELVNRILASCLDSDNAHLVTTGFALAVNLSASLEEDARHDLHKLVATVILPRINNAADASPTTLKMTNWIRVNALRNVHISDESKYAIFTLLNRSLKSLIDRTLSDPSSLEIARAVEIASGRILESNISGFSLVEIYPAAVISLAEAIEAAIGLHMENTIILCLD